MQNGLGIHAPFATSGSRIIPEVAGRARWRSQEAAETCSHGPLQTTSDQTTVFTKGRETSVHRPLQSLPTQKLPEAFLALRGNARPGMSENIGLQSGSSKRPFPKKCENVGPQTTSELTHSKLMVSNRPGRRSLPSYTFLPF